MARNERIRDLLPDYYLDQLSREETEEVRRHLATDRDCREALEEVEQTLGMMPFAAPSEEPPPDLKRRTVSQALDGEEPGVALPAPLYPEAGDSRAAVTAETAWGRYRRYVPSAAAAVLVVALALLSAAYLDLRQEVSDSRPSGTEPPVALAAQGTERAPDSRGTVVMTSSGGMALDVYGLPAPPEGHSYHAWLVGSGERVASLGEMQLNQHGDARMTGEVREPGIYEQVEVTVEPDGSGEKTGPVYLQARL